MDYTLILLSHGYSKTIDRCVESFADNVTPDPTKIAAVIDGIGSLPPVGPFGPWDVHQSDKQRGFCRATERCWQLGSNAETPYVFHLEADFVFTRKVYLEQMAIVLDRNRELAQVALMRNAVNEMEKSAGGLYESRLDQWHPHETDGVPWLEEREFFTSNPCLMRREFMEQNPWPNDGEPFCEGRFGIALRARGYSFGFLGRGEVWTEHIGVRSGMGY